MKRRSFLKTVAAASAGAALPHTSQAGEFTGVIKKAVKFQNVVEPKLSIMDKFKLVKDLGFDGTELRYNADYVKDKRQFINASNKTGLPIHGLIISSNTDIPGAIEFCSEVGGNGILVTAPYDKKKPLMESWRGRQEIFRKGLPAAEKHRVKILVENVWAGFLISALDMERFIDEVDNPWFGAYFDVGNNVRWGVPEHWIEVLGKRIGKLDIKEWDERLHRSEGLRAGFRSKLGEGTVNWANVRRALKKIGYSGWGTAEVGGGNREWLADLAERMNRVLDL
ncbi:MAG: xylose isomerase [Verrucomicrobiales bacterium]|nr:xylose isomerase [Verrucomicrobiales bacterium]|tara:strand:- start:195 stop:1037 length:843 start_codon:yes stop_codon:yes gene_type:complete